MALRRPDGWRATAARFTVSRASCAPYSTEPVNSQFSSFAEPDEGEARGVAAPITAGSQSRTLRCRGIAQFPHRRTGWGPIGASNAGVDQVRRLPRSFVQMSAGRDFRPDRNQVPTLSANEPSEAAEPFSDRRSSSKWRMPLWLYVPPTNMNSTACPSVQATPVSISGYPSPSPDIELSVTSSGKLTRRQLSWPGWKTRPWIRRLYGTICDPSTADRGAAAFISSLPVTPASPSALPESDEAKPTLAICGRRSNELSVKSSQRSSSPKMSKATSIWDLPTSPQAFAGWATAQKRACSHREKRALATAGDASSSWPTPTASDAGYMPDLMVGGTVRPTSPYHKAQGSSGQYSLTNAARAWTQLWRTMRALGWVPIAMPPCSHPVRVSFSIGIGSSIGDLISNPRFFEMVMGWPIDWTAPEGRVTGFAAWLRRSRGALSGLTLPGPSGLYEP